MSVEAPASLTSVSFMEWSSITIMRHSCLLQLVGAHLAASKIFSNISFCIGSVLKCLIERLVRITLSKISAELSGNIIELFPFLFMQVFELMANAGYLQRLLLINIDDLEKTHGMAAFTPPLVW